MRRCLALCLVFALIVPAVAHADEARQQMIAKSNAVAAQQALNCIMMRRSYMQSRTLEMAQKRSIYEDMSAEDAAEKEEELLKETHDDDLSLKAAQITFCTNQDYLLEQAALLAELYDTQLTDEELTDELGFYESPMGRSILESTRRANARAMQGFEVDNEHFDVTKIDLSLNVFTPQQQEAIKRHTHTPIGLSTRRKLSNLEYVEEYRYRNALLKDKYLQPLRFEYGLKAQGRSQ